MRETTLGDLLATLHRARAHGVLELTDVATRQRHAVHLRLGLVQAVESDLAQTRIGDVAARLHAVDRRQVERVRMSAYARGLRLGQALVAARVLTPSQLDEALRTQRRVRLEHLYALRDADVRFRVARPLPAGASEQPPLGPREVFHGRPRKHLRPSVNGAAFRAASAAASQARVSSSRSNAAGGDASASRSSPSSSSVPVDPARAARLAALGLATNARDDEVRRAYKRLVLELHPDRLAPDASERTREERTRALVSVLRAYRELSR